MTATSDLERWTVDSDADTLLRANVSRELGPRAARRVFDDAELAADPVAKRRTFVQLTNVLESLGVQPEPVVEVLTPGQELDDKAVEYVDYVFGEGASSTLALTTTDAPAIVDAFFELSEGVDENAANSEILKQSVGLKLQGLPNNDIAARFDLTIRQVIQRVDNLRVRARRMSRRNQLEHEEIFAVLGGRVELARRQISEMQAAQAAQQPGLSRKMLKTVQPLTSLTLMPADGVSFVRSAEGRRDPRDGGLCAQTDPEIFFPEQRGSPRDAKRICGECIIRQACLDFALANGEKYGVWGGMTARERRRLVADKPAEIA